MGQKREEAGSRLEKGARGAGAVARCGRAGDRTNEKEGCASSPARSMVSAAPLGLAGRTARKAQGLLLARPRDGALLLMPCDDVHTVGMRHRLDIAFVDASGLVLEAHRDVGPFRRIRKRGAVAVVERFSSCASPWFAKGDRVGMVRLEGGTS